MDYKVVTFPRDKFYVGMKYCDNEKSSYNDITSFWSYCTEELYNSKLVENLVDNNEAIGYRKYIAPDDRSSFDYYVSCETDHLLEESYGFDKIILTKGDYIIFKVDYKNKEKEIQEIVKHLNDVTEYIIDSQFDFEYYSAEFDYNNPDTHLYLAAQILGKQ